MDIRKELYTLTERMFTDELLDAMFREEDERQYGSFDKQGLPEQEKINEMEQLSRENLLFVLKYSFRRGMYAGFRQVFTKESTKCPFRELIENTILTLPGMKRERKFYERRCRIYEIQLELEEKLPETQRDCLLDICCLWEDRFFNILRQGFYLGYRFALAQAETVALPEDITEKILLTEYELGITLPMNERE